MTKLILAIIAAGLLTACSSNPCPDRGMAPFLAEARLLHAEFSDAYDLAYSSPRVSLSGQIQAMQDIRNRARRLDVLPCAEGTMALMVEGMDLAIDSLTEFMRDPEAEQAAILARSDVLAILDMVLVEMDTLADDPAWGLTPTPVQ